MNCVYRSLYLILFSFAFILILNTNLNAAFFESKSNILIIESFFFNKQKYLIFLIFFFPSLYFYNTKKFILFSIFLIIQIFIVVYWDTLILWIRDLGGDSLSEVNTFNFLFIYSWLLSIFSYFEPNLKITNFLKFYLVGFLLFFIFLKIFKRKKIYFLYFPLISSFIFLYLFFNFNLNHLSGNIITQKDIKKNFKESSEIYKKANSINFIIFIGESNSSLHTQKYIRKLLNNDEFRQKGKFLNLDNIYSTHTHSTPALLRLFSVPINNKDENLFKTIVKRESINIFSFFDKKIIKSYISSTGKSGFNNIHYPIFFENFDYKFFLEDSNYEFEKEFFTKNFDNIINKRKVDNLIVFHSSVGHAPYSKYIPKNIDLENFEFSKEYPIKLLGNKKKYYKDYIDYEKALNYNYQNLESIISKIDENTPTILVYLSDHGESVYTGTGHDSSRLVHEMLRIPFLIYYSNSFIEKYENNLELNKKFQNDINTSDILKKIIFDSYSLNLINKKYLDEQYQKYEKIIFQRNKNNTTEYIDLNFDRINLPNKYKLKTDKDTNVHILAKNIDEKKICYHAANTISRVIRGLHVTSCLEFDLIIEDDEFFIYHPPSKNIKFTLDELFDVSNKAKTYWIDAKNIDNSINCNILFNKIQNIKKDNVNYFIEFPSKTSLKNNDILDCIMNFKEINIDVSYYIQNSDINDCYHNLEKKNNSCNSLMNIVNDLDKKKIFDNISFDYKFEKIINYFNFEPLNLKLNTWHIEYEEVKNLDLEKYNLIIPYNSDHNRNSF